MMLRTEIEQLFRVNSNCYADTGRFENDGSYREGEVIQAMTEDIFVEIIEKLLNKEYETT